MARLALIGCAAALLPLAHAGCTSGNCVEGYGVYEWKNGDKYEGRWSNDKRNGHGVQVEWNRGKKERGQHKYIGDWKDDVHHGKGIQKWADGRVYDGDWKKGKRHGKGVATKPDGEMYDGGFKNGLRHGAGVHTWPDGKKFVGEFVGGVEHGPGEIIDAGSQYTGEWHEGEMQSEMWGGLHEKSDEF